MGRLALVWLAAATLAWTQAALSIAQLESFVRSSIQLKHQDREVANYLRTVKLRERLEDRIIVELKAAGAGPRTVEALEALREASKNLPPPPPPNLTAAAEIPPPSPAEWKKIIEAVREYAMNYTRQLPDFICTQVTRRYVDPSGLEFWQTQDTLTARLSYFEQKEDYKLVAINGRYTDLPYERVGGATSMGEFGSMLREIFDRNTQATFHWERWATLRGRRMHVFRYRVDQAHSQWWLIYQERDRYNPAYEGLIYVDRDTGVVARITLEAQDIPPGFPITAASTVLDYDLAEVGDRKYMLPLRAEIRMRQGRMLNRNEVEFRMYRKFAAEAVITFETPEPLPPESVTEQPPKP
ncbi:MAG: hypothetical protein K6T61_16935 [Bryobacteraceae bacterium]|nr:hypothetical protein [Bryobacteraceae bacterium]